MTGIKGACNRPKTTKRLRAIKGKVFRNDSIEARVVYGIKLEARRRRKEKKKGKKG